MIEIELTERVDLESTRERTKEGYLRVRANITKVGVSYYNKTQIPKARTMGGLPEQVGVFRPFAVLESQVTQDSIRLKPVTYNHPPGDFVNPSNYKQHTKGHVGSATMTSDGHLQVEMLIHDSTLIDRIESGQMEVSIGSNPVRMEREEGSFNGQNYHFRIDQPLDINHIAVVERGKGRAGSSVRILESKEQFTMDQETKDAITTTVKEAVAAALPEQPKLDGKPAGQVDTAALTASLTESISKVFAEERKKAEEAAAAADKAKEEKETALKESNQAATDRADILVSARQVMTQEAYDKVKDKPVVDILREALGSTVEGAENMEEAELRGAFKVAIKSRLSESHDGGVKRSQGFNSAMTYNGSASVVKSGFDYAKFKKQPAASA